MRLRQFPQRRGNRARQLPVRGMIRTVRMGCRSAPPRSSGSVPGYVPTWSFHIRVVLRTGRHVSLGRHEELHVTAASRGPGRSSHQTYRADSGGTELWSHSNLKGIHRHLATPTVLNSNDDDNKDPPRTRQSALILAAFQPWGGSDGTVTRRTAI